MLNEQVLKEYAWASFVTFVVAFAAAINALDLSSYDQAALFGILAVAAREGGRAVLNLLATRFMSGKEMSVSSRAVVK